MSIAGLAKTHCKLHKYPAAEDFYGRAYAIQSDLLGLEHPEVLLTMTAHASVLLILNRFAHAEEVYMTVLDMRCGSKSCFRSYLLLFATLKVQTRIVSKAGEN